MKYVGRRLLWMAGMLFLFCLAPQTRAQAARYSSTTAIQCYRMVASITSTSGNASCSLDKTMYYTTNGHYSLYLDGAIDCGTSYVSGSGTYLVEIAIQIDGTWKQIVSLSLSGGYTNAIIFYLYSSDLSNGVYPIKMTLFKSDNFTDGAELASCTSKLTVTSSITETVAFNYNGGSGSTSSKQVEWGEVYGTLPTATRSGYTFAGWYTKASGGTKVEEDSEVATWGSHTLYAHWTTSSTSSSTCTAFFNANGGTVSPSYKVVTYGSTYGTLPTPTRSNYTFTGWYTSPTGGTKVTSSTKVSKTYSHVLYAHWTNKKAQTITASSVTKTYVKNGTFKLNASAQTTLTYSSSNTSVVKVSSKGKVTMKGYGTAKITITAKSDSTYASATKTITIKIKPVQMTLASVKSLSSGQLTVQWNTDSKATGYEIQISTSKKFTAATTVSNSTTNNKLQKVTKKKLISGKKYYVRVRAFKTIDGKTVYGAWSEVKKKTVK